MLGFRQDNLVLGLSGNSDAHGGLETVGTERGEGTYQRDGY